MIIFFPLQFCFFGNPKYRTIRVQEQAEVKNIKDELSNSKICYFFSPIGYVLTVNIVIYEDIDYLYFFMYRGVFTWFNILVYSYHQVVC